MQCLCVHTFVQSSIPTPLGGIEPPAFRYNTILFKDKLPNRWMSRFSYKEREKSESRMPSTSQTPFIRSVGMVAHVLPCNKTQALLLQQKCNKFLWAKRREHPPLNVLIRPRLQGGLGVTLLFPFFLSLFTRQIFKSLIHPEGIERTATVYWLGPHLKNLLPQITQPRFNATHSSHPYFTTSLSTITDLLKAGIFTSSTVSNHRATYNHLIANIGQPGRTEIAKPDLDWASIWRWVAKIKGKNAEVVWDFNHNQLPTKMRLNSLHLSNNDQCPLCNAGQETDDHLMLLCKEKVDISLWLRIQLTKL
ncbi:hypothetical protein OUZ56_023557 [Daphnia magna]|uniref:Reverse transcriptase zinc-binding domain-containing protein n=1 Tax=Daphnia magna TaxID=35525 RepID=A0ABR0AZ95_9CRUS|nr:hypothetical protein OUZ56_023557 [Daphnia magna]